LSHSTSQSKRADKKDYYLTLEIDEQSYAVDLFLVERVIHAVMVSHLPGSPGLVQGIINYHGRIIPVLDIRKRFNLGPKPLEPNQHIVIARTERRSVAFVTDRVIGTTESYERPVESDRIVPGLENIRGVIKGSDGVTVIYDLDRFLSLEDEHRLDEAINSGNFGK
jgi:purine-binding chemotaxis protein CheW